MANFADRVISAVQGKKSFIIAGFDPQIETFPKFLLENAAKSAKTTEDLVYTALMDFHRLALTAVHEQVAAVKPNIAFFEQYGLAGLRAFADIVLLIKEHKLLVVADVKRGDIGSTAKAYSAAYLGKSSAFGRAVNTFDVDAITVNPFLGFDTVETYLDDCREFGKGLFVLVKTSNPGSAALQGIEAKQSGHSVSESVAAWLGEKAELLRGSTGYSGLGAVVGATYPDEARKLRTLMPRNLLLIPGMGAQGGSAKDAVAGFSSEGSGALINISRGLLGGLPANVVDDASLVSAVKARAIEFNSQITAALS